MKTKPAQKDNRTMKAIIRQLTGQDLFLIIGTVFIIGCCAYSIINL